MSDARWRRVQDLYHGALERPAPVRAEFLSQECAGDAGLLHEVQSLLDQPISADQFLVAGASSPSDTSSVRIGQRLGVYQVTAFIGRGGMGEVYRAHDMTLGRDVAIKILPRAFTSDPDRLARFEREARLLASLNHPNIGAIYGVEESDGIRALVLELVEGETLADRVTRGPIPLKEALPIARQIAEALDAAHAKGIVHRDLKPGNVALSRESTVKVLDFGLAKASAYDAAADGSPAQTMAIGGTRGGVVLGTAAYMSPEQARGQGVDKRTDIWAFGCVLFEMLTGQVAFSAETVTDTIAAVLEREPNWAALPLVTPVNVRRLIGRCLEKDPKKRLRDIGDAAIELNDAKVMKPRKLVPRWVWGSVAGIAMLGLALGWIVSHPRQPVVERRAVRLAVNPPAGTEFGADTGMAISPDGRMLAFVTASAAGTKLWIRPLNSMSAREPTGAGGATFPFWSPDSRSIAFFAMGKLKRIEVSGGLPTEICGVGEGKGGAWSEAGIILFNSVNDGPLLQVPATGGTPVPITTVDKAQGENSHRWPQFLPGGRQFLYFVRNPRLEDSGMYLGSLDRPQDKTRVLSSTLNAVYAVDRGKPFGQLLWVREGTLVAQSFDPERGQTRGEPYTVAEGVAFNMAGRLGAVSTSNEGTLLYGGTEIRQLQLTWYDREGKHVGEVGQPDAYAGVRISPDGKRVAIFRSQDIWQIEFARGIPTRVTFDRGADPLWSPDGQRIAYWKGGPPNLFARNMNGTGNEERLTESHDTLRTQDWSPDGKFLLHLVNSNDLSSKMQADLWVLPMTGGGKPVPFLSTPFREGRGQFSPDGNWVAYTSDESGGNEVYVQKFPAGGSKLPVSKGGGDWVRWRKDGREMFYIAPDRKVMSVSVQTVSGSLELGVPQALFTIPVTLASDANARYSYDVMPDGRSFLALAPVGDAELPPLTVILNWQAELSTARK